MTECIMYTPVFEQGVDEDGCVVYGHSVPDALDQLEKCGYESSDIADVDELGRAVLSEWEYEEMRHV